MLVHKNKNVSINILCFSIVIKDSIKLCTLLQKQKQDAEAEKEREIKELQGKLAQLKDITAGKAVRSEAVYVIFQSYEAED